MLSCGRSGTPCDLARIGDTTGGAPDLPAIPMNGTYRILVINPGSTSTKISVFENERSVFEKSQFHEASVLLQFAHVNDQMPFRRAVILDLLEKAGFSLQSMDAFVGRGGAACSQPGGITLVDQKLYDDTARGIGESEHPCKLGVMLAYQFAQECGKQAYTLNPTTVDEFCDLARLTGIKGVYRTGHSHVLNHKAVAEAHAATLGKRYEDCNFVVAHIDGGITVAAHDHGRLVDGNMGADGEGAFTPTRIGSVPLRLILKYLQTHTAEDVRLLCARAGGFVELLGTSDAAKVHRLVEEGDEKATLVWQTMIYQICKMIGEMATVLCGNVDAILLTGGLMRYADILDGIRRRCGFIAPIAVYPGEMEQEALALPTLKVLRGELAPRRYTGKNVWDGFGRLGL